MKDRQRILMSESEMKMARLRAEEIIYRYLPEEKGVSFHRWSQP